MCEGRVMDWRGRLTARLVHHLPVLSWMRSYSPTTSLLPDLTAALASGLQQLESIFASVLIAVLDIHHY